MAEHDDECFPARSQKATGSVLFPLSGLPPTGPQATSTPNSDVLSYGTNQATKSENQLTLREVLNILCPNLKLATVELPTSQDGKHWTDRSLSVRACYEILYGVITEKIPQNVEGRLLEILCFYLENTFKSQDIVRIQDNKFIFRTFIPALHTLLAVPTYGPWVAKLLGILYKQEGIVLDPVVRDLLHRLNAVSVSRLTKALREAIVALLHQLQPLRPDLISDSIFKGKLGCFPEYDASLRDRLAESIPPDVRFTSLLDVKAYDNWHASPLHVDRRAKWFTADALTDHRMFVEFWSKIRFPDDPTTFLADSDLLDAFWLAPKPSTDAVTMERRIFNAVDDLLQRNTDNEENILRMFDLAAHVSDHIHEIQPAICSAALHHLKNLKSPIEIFIKAISSVSVIYLAGNDAHFLEEVFEQIRLRCQMEEAAIQFRMLEATQTMLQDFCRDLPRLWALEETEDELAKQELATAHFVHSETAVQACYVDTQECLAIVINYLDAILWEPLLIKPCGKPYNALMWSRAIEIWSLLADIDRHRPEFGPFPPIVVPHTEFLQCGALHKREFIADQIVTLMKRYVALDDQRNETTERIEIVRKILDASS